ncbi:MAG: methyltransferase domain-containing protein [Pirellulales bacterium]|nr:methyltransferase domain-containing protein [Pirellulales bacterium]
MLRRMVKNLAKRLGYDIIQRSPVDRLGGYEMYHYRKADGTFDYEKYREVQTEGNKRKIENVWVLEENIAFLADYIKRRIPEVKFGLCHGTRRGKEQEYFRKYLGCDVLGTEISDTAEQFPDTIQWDFHEVKPEWIDAVDFIYSNAFDHSYDPRACLNAWMRCVRPGGLCILEHTNSHARANQLDPFGAEVSVMPYLILTWSEGKFSVRELLDAPVKPSNVEYMQYLIIERF